MSIQSPGEWADRAACKGADTELFFPPNGMKGHREAKDIIELYCNNCTVRSECLLWALQKNEQGIWGGFTDIKRHNSADAVKILQNKFVKK